jgi:hypothetical protein
MGLRSRFHEDWLQAVVLYAWEGDASRGELTLKEGDLIALTRWVDPEWLEGDLAGTVGMGHDAVWKVSPSDDNSLG